MINYLIVEYLKTHFLMDTNTNQKLSEPFVWSIMMQEGMSSKKCETVNLISMI